MKIRALCLEQFKKFDEPVCIRDFADGLNLLAGPNEMGKSTLLLALRAVLFERHSTKSQAIKTFQPNHIQGAAPSVAVDFEIDRSLYHLEKRFLRRPMARLVDADGQVFEGQDAEAAIKTLLRLENSDKVDLDKGSPGHFGVMFTPQGHAFRQPSLAEPTRHSLQEVVTAEIAQLGNQSEVDAVLANIDGATFEILDRRGKEKGRYRDVVAQLAEIEREIEALHRDRDDLAEDRAALNAAEARLRDLDQETSDRDLETHLADLENRRDAESRYQAVEARRLAARHRLDNLIRQRDQRRKILEDQARLTTDNKLLADEEATLAKQLEALESDLQEQQQRRRSLEDAEQAHRQKRRQLEQLGDQIGRLAEIENALLAMATEVTIELDTAALEQVRLDGTTAERVAQVIQVTEGLTIDIQNVGQIGIRPKIDSMQALRDKQATLGDSLAKLRDVIGLGSTDSVAMESVWQDLTEAEAAIHDERNDGEAALSSLHEDAEAVKTSLHATTAKRRQIETRLIDLAAEIGDGDNADERGERILDLDAEIAKAEAEHRAASGKVEGEPDVRQGAPEQRSSLDELEAEIKQGRARLDQRREQISEAKLTIERLRTKVAMRAGRGLDERLEDSLRRRDVLGLEKAAFELDVKALTLLTSTLTDAANDAKAQFHTPLTQRLTPYLQALLPGAVPEVTPDFGITALHRDGVADQRFEQLSDGTREQIAVLVRLAFADMLREQNLPALVILDDALAFSDERRLDRIFGILEGASKTMQVIILTCREDRFEKLDAKRLVIEPNVDDAPLPSLRSAARSA